MTTTPTPSPAGELLVEQRHRDAAAALALGYKDWDDATDYRNTGGQIKAIGSFVQAFARFERDHLATPPSAEGALLDRLYRSHLPSDPALPHASEEWKDARAKADVLLAALSQPLAQSEQPVYEGRHEQGSHEPNVGDCLRANQRGILDAVSARSAMEEGSSPSPRATPAPSLIDGGEVEAVARAIEDANSIGYTIRLVRLVDGVSTYHLLYDDSDTPLEFESNLDANDHVRNRRRLDQARAAIAALRQTDRRGEDQFLIGQPVHIIADAMDYPGDWRSEEGKVYHVAAVKAEGDKPLNYTLSNNWPVRWPGFGHGGSELTDDFNRKHLRTAIRARADSQEGEG